MKLKLIVAALAIAASASAHADIDLGSTGNGELFLDLVNKTIGMSVTIDLTAPTSVVGTTFTADPHLNDFLPGLVSTPGMKLSWDLNNWAAWGTFKSAVGNTAGTKFDLAALDTTGTKVGDIHFLTTSNSPLATIQNQSNSNLTGFAAVDTGLVAGQNTLQTAANDAATATSGSAYFYGSGAKGDSWNSKFTGVSTADVTAADGSVNTQSFYMLTTGGTPGNTVSGLTKASVTAYAGQWGVDYANNTLTYSVAAVPEADTWAMLLAGLGMMGFIARRRLQG